MRMAKNLVFYDCEDEDYIEMVCCSTNSSPQNREFEFQMSESTIFPADELFYQGKLLPLHLLLHGGSATAAFDYYTVVPQFIPCTNSNTPLDSCNISPSESCRVSCELSPDDHFFEWSAELSRFVDNHSSEKYYSWCKKLKRSLLGQKLKSSRNYLKSLFSKSACSGETCAKAKESFQKLEEIPKSYIKTSYPTIATVMKKMDEDHLQRKSFSGVIKRQSLVNYKSSSPSNSSSLGSSSSSSFSLNSNGVHELEFHRRSSSVAKVECSIEAAIAHCKNSHTMIDKV